MEYSDALWSLSVDLAKDFLQNRIYHQNSGSAAHDRCIWKATLQASKLTYEGNFRTRQTGDTCCPGCLATSLYEMEPHGFSDEKQQLINKMYAEATRFLVGLSIENLSNLDKLHRQFVAFRQEEIIKEHLRRQGPRGIAALKIAEDRINNYYQTGEIDQTY